MVGWCPISCAVWPSPMRKNACLHNHFPLSTTQCFACFTFVLCYIYSVISSPSVSVFELDCSDWSPHFTILCAKHASRALYTWFYLHLLWHTSDLSGDWSEPESLPTYTGEVTNGGFPTPLSSPPSPSVCLPRQKTVSTRFWSVRFLDLLINDLIFTYFLANFT